MERFNFIKKTLQNIPHQAVAFTACVVFIIGLIAGRAWMSIGMMLLLANAIINLQLPFIFKQFRKNTTALLFVGLFLLFGLSFFWSENVPYYVSRMQLMLPFLAMPFAFQAIKWNDKYYDYLAMLFVSVIVAGTGWSIFQYLQEKDAIDEAYRFSKSMPTPFLGDHIRFGMAIVLAIIFCFQIIKKYKKMRWVFIASAIFLIGYSHLLASKTALLSLYLISIYEIFLMIIRKKKILLGFVLFAIVFTLPFVFYFLSPSFRNKMVYTKYSFEQLNNGKDETNISDEGRLVSYQAAIEVVKKNWFVGVGVGDGLDEMKLQYKNLNIVTEKILYPHNEFLYIALILGSVGLIYFLCMMVYIVKNHFRSSDWMASFLLLFIVPLTVEAFFNTQYGIALFVFFFFLLERRSRTID